MKGEAVAEYRWERASGGTVPEGAPEGGHGYYELDDGERQPLWVVRSLPDVEGGVRLGYLRYGGALVGEAGSEEEVDEYEVLLDDGTWGSCEEDGEGNVNVGVDGAYACGQLADGTPLYVTLVGHYDAVGEGPAESPATAEAGDIRRVLMAPTGAATPPSPASPDASGYRWGRAAGGEIPDGVAAEGHGWRYHETDEGDMERVALWLVRSGPDADGAVRLGYVERGKPARVGPERREEAVDEYEVLLDAGEWRYAEPVDTEDDSYLDLVAAGGVACGRLADGTPVYATLRDREGEGFDPGENPGRTDMNFNRTVLVAPVGVAAPSEPAAAEAPPAGPEPAGPMVVVRALDLRGEVVEIANTGDAPIDLGGWKLHDEGSTKGFVFPAGTVLAAGASVRVRSGPGAAKAGPGELKWKTASVWNDRGDTAFLKDPSGELVDSMKV